MQKSGIRRRIKRFLLFIILAALLYFIGFIAAVHVTGLQDETESADIIIVLGAGLRDDGRPGPALTRRSRQGANLWHQGVAPLVLCTGGRSEYYPRTEAAACREILFGAGLPAGAILTEKRSRSTEENAIYSRHILDDMRLARAVLVSDSYHMLRARWLFQLQGIEVMTSPVSRNRIRGALVYPLSLAREFIAFNWQIFKEVFQLPVTHIQGI
ncbi:MAG: YdcF family protein [Chloroflexota bacterium]|nr:YdcF family protein [Chloroflexota bacterium]MDE2948675.1 YdcF family protein [Chloroflexota bacterium]